MVKGVWDLLTSHRNGQAMFYLSWRVDSAQPLRFIVIYGYSLEFMSIADNSCFSSFSYQVLLSA